MRKFYHVTIVIKEIHLFTRETQQAPVSTNFEVTSNFLKLQGSSFYKRN